MEYDRMNPKQKTSKFFATKATESIRHSKYNVLDNSSS